MIDAHLDAGTCHICGKKVDDGTMVYAITGAHWDCHEGQLAKLTPLLNPDPSTPARTGTFMARAAGGFMMHVVDAATNKALCGHTLKNTAFQMRRRSRWIEYPEIPQHLQHCRKCTAEIEKRGHPQPTPGPLHAD